MGVVFVFTHPVPESKSGQQVVDALQRHVELLGAIKSGTFSVDCDSYQSSNINIASLPGSRVLHVLHNSEQPASCFSILDTGTCLIADNLFDVLILKVKGYYQQRKGAKIESKGSRFEFGDFIIKIGSVTLASNFRGILIELKKLYIYQSQSSIVYPSEAIEYCPVLVPTECWLMIRELLQGIVGFPVDSPPAYMKTRMDSLYSPSDTVGQYLEHFNTFRKAVPPPQASR